MFCRPAGLRLYGTGQAVDIGLGGARIFADESVERGTRLELELILADGGVIVCKAEVAWVEAMPPESPARFDVGLQFTDVSPEDRLKLAKVLDAPV